MHILCTADTLGGVWTYTRELVTGLARRGVKVTLVSFGEIPSFDQTRWMESLSGLDYHPTAFKLEWMQDSAADIDASSRYLQEIIEHCRPDVLHLNQFCYGSLQCDVPRIVVAHSDVVSWWLAARNENPPESAWLSWYRENVTRGLSHADTVIAPSRWMLDQIKLHYVEPKKSSVIFNGRTPLLFNPYLTKDVSVVTMGRLWDCGKNAALLTRGRMPAPVTVIGADRHPESKNSVFAAGEINPDVRLEPPQDESELVLTLARAGIYAATSQYEPFGLAPVEAALSRCAIVASDISSFRELWEGAALFFHNNDADSLRAALRVLVDDPALRRRYGNLAYEHARRNFSADRMVDDYLHVYHTLIPASVLAS